MTPDDAHLDRRRPGKTNPARLKLFFAWEEGSETPYGELFLNLDLPNRVLELNEKDPEYRPAILAALST